ncbi:hypothetical protein PsorP6_015008 [Peronosclerospora sorghi]|uniref:Uncharacterized protein n=1 Tax=Peronosclerospora sorghi TaxID=230839 RepID=A0ACC0VU63_9STRA|nr:hypothetical protein PsorP6_015008 [Peronosclerospora sorghi]
MNRRSYSEVVQSGSRRANKLAASDDFPDFPNESPNEIRGIQDGISVFEGPGIKGTKFRIKDELDLEGLGSRGGLFIGSSSYLVAQAETPPVEPAVEEDLAAEEYLVAEEDPTAA